MNLDNTIETLKSEIQSIKDRYTPDFSYEEKKLKEICPKYLLELANDYDFYIAGGMITSLFTKSDVNDIDIYVKNKDHVFSFISELYENSQVMSITDKSILFEINRQAVNVVLIDVFDSAEKIFDKFDFTVVMGAYDMQSNEFFFHRDFFKHNAQRIIKFNAQTDFPLVSALRVGKYKERGYNISKMEYVRILLSCVNLNIDSYEKLEAHIGGMYGVQLSEIIDTEKEFNLTEIIEELTSPKKEKEIDDLKKLVWDEDEDLTRDKLSALLEKYIPVGVTKIGEDVIVHPSGRIDFCSLINLDSIPERTEPIFMYKFVKRTKDPNKYISFHDNSFKYELGKEVSDSNKGIFCGSFSCKKKFAFNHEESKILIELKINVGDIICLSDTNTRVKKAIVTKVFTEDVVNDERTS